jgi:hypothetical protein
MSSVKMTICESGGDDCEQQRPLTVNTKLKFVCQQRKIEYGL